jgi:hypothetical protein
MTSSVPDLSRAPCLEELLQVGFLSTETTETTETSVPNGDNGDEYRSTRASHLGAGIPQRSAYQFPRGRAGSSF